jgi:phosphoribosylanthranilate isomerase
VLLLVILHFGASCTRAWYIDVSSGVEDRLGVKSPEKIRAFLKAARGL